MKAITGEIVRIIIDARTATPHFPGIGRYTHNLLTALADFGKQLSLYVIRSPSTFGYPLTVPYDSATTAVSVFSLRQQWVIPQLIRTAVGSLYHSTYYLMPYMVPIPLVFTCYDLIPLIYPGYFTIFTRTIYSIAHRIASAVSAHVITISESTKSDLVKYFSADAQKITAIPLAADSIFKPQAQTAVEAVRSRFGIPKKYCLYVGTNKPHKNLTRLLEAWKLLNHSRDSQGHFLVIVGRWDERYPEARDYALQSGLSDSVRFVGEVPDDQLPAIYSGATVFVHPSLYEGFGLPIVEAMACGTPVVCSNTSSLPEVAGQAAMFFDPQDPRGMATVLGTVLADKNMLDSMKQKSLVQAARFSWKETARKTIEVYRRTHISHR